MYTFLKGQRKIQSYEGSVANHNAQDRKTPLWLAALTIYMTEFLRFLTVLGADIRDVEYM